MLLLGKSRFESDLGAGCAGGSIIVFKFSIGELCFGIFDGSLRALIWLTLKILL